MNVRLNEDEPPIENLLQTAEFMTLKKCFFFRNLEDLPNEMSSETPPLGCAFDDGLFIIR